MKDAPDNGPGPHFLGFLKILVTGLALTMIIGLIVLVVLFVKRFPRASTDFADFPAGIALPADAEVTAFTRGPGWLAVVTRDGRILIYSPDGQELRQEIDVETDN